ncbi:MAG: molybdate ABC transporter substrate-binding protein [Phycisphaerae bacterium]
MKQIVAVAIVIMAVMLFSCESKKTEQPDSEVKELLLYCGAGIRPPADELVRTFEHEHGVKIAVDYAGSEVLVSKIKLVRRGDLYMPGDKHYVDQAAGEGMILSQRSVCYFVPTILVQKSNPKNISGLEGLLQPGLKLGLGDDKACAIGRTTRQILAKNNIGWEDIEKNLAFQSLTVNELGMQIQAKALDAVIVWDAIARYYSEYGDEIPIPPEKNVISTIDIGVLKFSKHRELAEKFVEFVASARGRDIFRKYNYTVELSE